MRKIRLDVDHLRVESFATDFRAGGRRGTVRGNSVPLDSIMACDAGTDYTETCTSEYDAGPTQDTCDGGRMCGEAQVNQ
jgi:hypothetical protein